MILVNRPILGKREKELLTECIESGWISSDGPFVSQFEQNFAKFLGAENGIAVCNGTAALEVGLYSLGVKPGDEVILPSFTIISCAIAITRLGAVPVLVDIEPDTWTIDVSKIEAKITPKTKVIMAVHMYGHSVDMDPLINIAKTYNLKILEDAAQVHGALYKNKKLGSIGDAAAFSFYANKIITTGEGGMVVTSISEVAQKAQSYRNLYFQPKQRFLHEEVGYNFRMTNMQAALGVAQLEKIEEFVTLKRKLAEYYHERLKSVKNLQLQIEKPWAKSVFWMNCIQLHPSLGRPANFVIDQLKQKGIECRPFFLGLHHQPAFQKLGLFKNEDYPVTDQASLYGLYLPSSLDLKISEVDMICDRLKSVIEN